MSETPTIPPDIANTLRLGKGPDSVIRIGYWRSDEDPTISPSWIRDEPGRKAWASLPWPGDHVDPTMPESMRNQIVGDLKRPPIVARYRGNSPSRLSPGGTCGGCEQSNGKYVWPVGLVHYVKDHGLILPPEFLDSIRGQP